jgi:hypothetical protein
VETKSSSISYHGKQITVTATQQGPEQEALVASIEIDGAPVEFGPGDIEPGDSLDDAIANGIRTATTMVDY